MLRTVLVIVHAGSGLAGLLVGLSVLSPPARVDARTWRRRAYAACIVVLLVSMVALIAVDWNDLVAGARVAFSGLAGLGAVMAYRLVRAHHEARTRGSDWQPRYIDHVYFTYVSLWIGFLIVPALNLPYPQVAVPLVPLATLFLGHMLVGRYKQRVLTA